MLLNTPKQYVDYLCKHKISPTQFLFLYIIYENDYASLYKYVHENGGFELKELEDLEESEEEEEESEEEEDSEDEYYSELSEDSYCSSEED